MENYSFGKLIAGFRGIYDLSQEDLADMLSCSRMTVNTFEKVDSVSDLTTDSLFRLFHLFNTYCECEGETWYQEHLLKCVDSEIKNRINGLSKEGKVKRKTKK